MQKITVDKALMVKQKIRNKLQTNFSIYITE